MAALERVQAFAVIAALVLMASASRAESTSLASRFVRVAPEPLVEAFLTPDQQGRAWLEGGEPLRAAALFVDPIWKGIAFEEAGALDQAAVAFAQVESAEGAFRQGNALARLQELVPAARAYEEALRLRPDFPEAAFNLDWIQGMIELANKEYEDFGGTGGQLEADEFVFDDRAANAIGEMTVDEARAQGLGAEEIRQMWMRRVQTTPGDFLRLKFAYQAQDDVGNERATDSETFGEDPAGEASP